MFNILLYVKKVTNIISPFGLILLLSILTSFFVYLSMNDVSVTRTVILSLSFVMLSIGMITQLILNQFFDYKIVDRKKVLYISCYFLLSAILLWNKGLFDNFCKPVLLIIILWLTLLSILYRAIFKKMIVNMVIKDNFSNLLSYDPLDFEQTGEGIAEELTNSVKEEYKDKIFLKLLRYSQNPETHMMEYLICFLTNSKKPRILFEFVVMLKMEDN